MGDGSVLQCRGLVVQTHRQSLRGQIRDEIGGGRVEATQEGAGIVAAGESSPGNLG